MTNLLLSDSVVKEVLKYFAIAVLLLGVIFVAIVLITPRNTKRKLIEKTKEFFSHHKTFGEILRFIIVGGLATLIDMFFMGVTMYFMQKNIYQSFLNVFINTPNPSTAATVVGTAVGFTVGLIFNYILSILFVFNEKGKSKSTKGFIVFTVLSVIGLLLNVGGMYLGYDVLNINQWVVKIVMTLIVLVYNYISKKLLLFKKDKNQPNQN